MTSITAPRPAPGSPASNQYGEFKVHHGTDRQVAYIKRLIAERDTAGIEIPADVDNLNKNHTSDLIDALLNCPVKPGATPNNAGATDKQIALVVKLAGEKNWEDLASPSDGAVIRHCLNGATTAVNKREVSSVIDWMFSLARKQAPVDRDDRGREVSELVDAIYLKDGVILKVYHTVHGANVQVAKKLVTDADGNAEWEYIGKRGLAGLMAEHRMTLEQAKEYGAIYGVCINCCRTLTNEVSIEAAMGPVCRKRFA